MLQTNCKLDQFVNGTLVYEPVIQSLNWLAHFHEVVLFRNRAERFKSWLNGWEAGSLNGWEAVQANSPWPEWHEAGLLIY